MWSLFSLDNWTFRLLFGWLFAWFAWFAWFACFAWFAWLVCRVII
jgi:hypothetical protein